MSGSLIGGHRGRLPQLVRVVRFRFPLVGAAEQEDLRSRRVVEVVVAGDLRTMALEEVEGEDRLMMVEVALVSRS